VTNGHLAIGGRKRSDRPNSKGHIAFYILQNVKGIPRDVNGFSVFF
jgi:hypothetical protein